MGSRSLSARLARLVVKAGFTLTVGVAVAQVVDVPQSAGLLSDLMPSSITQCRWPAATSEFQDERISRYVEAADHVRLALDIFTDGPLDRHVKVPTLFTATRYGRALEGAPINEAQRRWVAAGYAVVNADVRGTGASFGQWYVPYSPQEARDLGLLAHWISHQPWSNGSVVMAGTSYPGTTPLLAAAYGSPALKAIAPLSADFDMYADLLWPGGVAAEDLSVQWGSYVRALDLNEPQPDDNVPPMLKGVRPVDGRRGARLLGEAVDAHKRNSWSFESAPYEVTFRDQQTDHMHAMSIDDGATYRHDRSIERSRIPIFGWGSWLDSGIAQGLLNRFMTLSNPQLSVIGPWTHGARANANVYALDAPLEPSTATQDQWIYCFLDTYAHGDASTAARRAAPATLGRRILYFTMGENRWKSTGVWPLPTTRQRRMFLDSNKMLSDQPSTQAGLDTYDVDFEATTGSDNRWSTQMGKPRIDYGDRALADRRLLAYTSRPLDTHLEITGQPVVTLNVTSNRSDGNFIVYLEDVAPDGKVTYLTEGELRALHRKLASHPGPYKTTYPYRTYSQKDASPLVPGEQASLTFQLQATSVRLEAGHRLRLALAGADKGTFLAIPADTHNVTLKISRGGSRPSFIDLPEIPP
jgi:putative CocE/NonD family hydrolase